MYAIVDIETTGGSPVHDRITEIAIYIHDGENIVDELVSLVNPERYIPPNITQLTGITNEMVENAPRFYELAKRIVEITEDRIFVAHHVSFDYSFVRNEFKQLGYTFRRPRLCTVKLSRKLIPGMRSYSLGRLCDQLGIALENRHRAAGDAMATVRLFDLLLGMNEMNRIGPSLFRTEALKNLNPQLNLARVEEIPEETGVYYFYDKDGTLLYIGKSKNMYQRVITHLRNQSSGRAMRLRDRTAEIGYERTGSELIALLKESHEIKESKPMYNRQQRRTIPVFGIMTEKDGDGYIRFFIGKDLDRSISSFPSMAEARSQLGKLVEEYRLCQRLSGLYDSPGACFHRQIGQCLGACTGLESPDTYNLRAERLLMRFEFAHRNFYILDRGRQEEEYSVIKIENGSYRGFGYIQREEINTDLLSDCIHPYPDNRDIRRIIKNYLRTHQVQKILPIRNGGSEVG